MAVKTPRPPMVGGLTLSTALIDCPGPKDVVDKLALDGPFRIDDGTFTERGVQAKINDLSRTGLADRKVVEEVADRKAATSPTSPADSNWATGGWRSRHSASTSGRVPCQLHGDYSLRRETLASKATSTWTRNCPETTTGLNSSAACKIADPIFRHNGKPSCQFQEIAGSRNDPKPALDYKRVFNR